MIKKNKLIIYLKIRNYKLLKIKEAIEIKFNFNKIVIKQWKILIFRKI